MRDRRDLQRSLRPQDPPIREVISLGKGGILGERNCCCLFHVVVQKTVIGIVRFFEELLILSRGPTWSTDTRRGPSHSRPNGWMIRKPKNGFGTG